MGILESYAHGVYGIGDKGKHKKGKGYSMSGHMSEHLGC